MRREKNVLQDRTPTFMVEDHLHEEKPLLLDSNMEALKSAQ